MEDISYLHQSQTRDIRYGDRVHVKQMLHWFWEQRRVGNWFFFRNGPRRKVIQFFFERTQTLDFQNLSHGTHQVTI
jgi:hypothetical protein